MKRQKDRGLIAVFLSPLSNRSDRYGFINGKKAIITGAGRGIGRAAAIALAKEGVNIGLIGLTLANLEKTAEEIKEFGVTPSTVATDLAIETNLTDGNPESVMKPEDLAEFMAAQLKLNSRVFVKTSGLWSTNP